MLAVLSSISTTTLLSLESVGVALWLMETYCT
jgi:hypothetical protein